MTRHGRRSGTRSAWCLGLSALVLLSLLAAPASADQPPVINSFSPMSGPVGTLVTIKGNHFTGTTEVTIKDALASFTIVTDSKITATVPDGATTGRIRVTTPAGTATSADNFKVTTGGGGGPVINSFSPTSGPVDTVVTIKGNRFTGATSVTFKDNVQASFTVDSDNQITTTVPQGAVSGRIQVTTPDGTASSPTAFKVTVPKPVITSFSPLSGPVGTVVTIFGKHFTGTSSVVFKDNLFAQFTVLSDGQISATVPQGAQTGRIRVTAPGGIAESNSNFTVIPPPNINSFSPMSGTIGTRVTIQGSNFSNLKEVRFGALTAPFSLMSGSQVVATIPRGASTGQVSLTTPGGVATSAGTFVVVHPRRVTIKRPRPLVAEGVVRTLDRFAQCGAHVPVLLQHKINGHWKWAGRGMTRADGSYRVKLHNRTGRYRARVLRWMLSTGDVCARATSGKPSPVPPAPEPPPGPPPANGTFWGVFAFPRNGLTAEEQIQLVESGIGRNFSAQRVYTNMNETIPNKTDLLVAGEGRLLYHNFNSFHPVHGRKVCYRWSDIAAGQYDNMLVDLANSVRAWGYPLIMSFTHEPNVDNPNHPQCGTPTEYQAAFDHVVDVFNQQGATNVTWAWVLSGANFNGADGGPTAFEPQQYDVIGVDAYNHASNWRTAEQIFQSAEDFAQSRGKPLIIGEVGCEERSGDPNAKANWLADAAAVFKSWGDVNVIFWTHTGNGGEWWLDSSAQALAAFAAAGQDPYFI